MASKRQLERGLYRKPCGCLVIIAPFGDVLSEMRCEAEGSAELNFTNLVPVAETKDERVSVSKAKPLAQPMLSKEEIAELKRESAEAMKQFRRMLSKKKTEV